MPMNSDRPPHDPTLERLEVDVDGRHVEAERTRFTASENGPRQPRWMLRIDGGDVLRGPLTWDTALDPETERAAIVAHVRERHLVASEYRALYPDRLAALSESGGLARVADALGVAPTDLVPDHTG